MDFSMKYTGKQEKTCPIHGPYISDTLESTIFGKLDTKCPKCVELWEQRQQVDERTEALETMRIPPIFWDKTIDTFETRDSKLLEASLYAAKRFIDSPSRQKNLILLGASQCGKTHLACSVLMEIKYKIKRYTNIIEIMDAIKNTYSNKSGKGKEAIINTYAFVDCLIIDNMEMFNPTKDNVTSLFSLLEKRYNWMKSTIICSRTSAGELHNLVGDGLYQKIKSGGVERVLSEKFILN